MAEPALEDKITLNVFVEDDEPDQGFTITIALQDNLSDVRSVIQKAYWECEQISIYGLKLYKANISTKQVANAKLSEETLLEPFSTVASEWPSKTGVDRSLVHIIVRPRSRQVTNTQRAITPPPPETEFEKLIKKFQSDRAKFVDHVQQLQIPSSTASHHKNFREQQFGDNFINIGRPADKVWLSIVLYHPVFGRFLRGLRSSYPQREVYQHTEQHLAVSQDMYEGETKSPQAKDDITRASLHRLLGDAFQKIKANGVEADGVIPGMHGTYLTIMEMKNEVGMGGSDPSVQVAQSYMRYWSDPAAADWLNSCCCPSILIGIAGPWMSVLGAIFLDRPVVQPLTDFLWAGENSSRPSNLGHIVRVFDCMNKARTELGDYYREQYPPPAGEHTLSPFPYLTYYSDSTGQTVHFTYRKSLCPANPEKSVFLAETIGTENPRPIVVKFVQKYNADAHKLLAEHGLAPELLYDGTMYPDDQPGPEHNMIVMGFVQGVDLQRLGSTRLPRSIYNDIEKAINLLHGRDFVFGDLREPNVMVLRDSMAKVNGKAMLVDFDWCGKHGEDRYPQSMNMEIGWHGDVGPEAVMSKEHDTHMLAELDDGIRFPL